MTILKLTPWTMVINYDLLTPLLPRPRFAATANF